MPRTKEFIYVVKILLDKNGITKRFTNFKYQSADKLIKGMKKWNIKIDFDRLFDGEKLIYQNNTIQNHFDSNTFNNSRFSISTKTTNTKKRIRR